MVVSPQLRTKEQAMTRVSALDREKLWWDAVEDASRSETPDEIPRVVLPVLKHVLGADGVGCHWINLREAHENPQAYPSDFQALMLEPATFEAYRRLMLTHPWLVHYSKTASTDPRAISELLTLHDWHNYPLYQDVFRPCGIEDQLAGFVMGDERQMLGLSASFDRSGAAGRHEAFMFRAGKMVSEAYSRVERQRGLRSVESVLSDAAVLPGRAVIVLDRHGRVEFSGGGLLNALCRELGLITDGRRLPTNLQYAIDTCGNSSEENTSTSVRLQEFGIRFLHFNPQTGESVLLIDQSPTITKVDALSPNMVRTVELLGGGMNNHQVAQELNLSVETVRTYRARAFKILGVHKIEVAVAMIMTWRQQHTTSAISHT